MTAETLSPSWLVLTIPALVGGIILVSLSVALLLRTVRVHEFARLPLSAQQEFDLTEAGPLCFLIDKPRLGVVARRPLVPFGLSVSLEDSAGRVLETSRVLAPLSIAGVRRTRTEIANLTGAAAGHYKVRVAGLAAGVEHADSFLVVAPPIPKLTMALSIVAIVISSAMALGGLIASVATFVRFQSG
ncbi:MAG: hypothetical protein ACREFI_14115 [Stellaceae bacterium]